MDYADFVRMLAKPLPTRNERLDHATLGLVGELGEFADAWKKHLIYGQPFDRDNAIEELGDLCFYMQMWYSENFEQAMLDPDPQATNTTRSIFLLADNIGALAGGHDADPDHCLWEINQHLTNLASQLGVTIDQVKIMNMEKLSKRYPDKVYTDAHAKERLDKQEY